MLDLKGRAIEDIVDIESGEIVLEKGEIPSLDTLGRVGALRTTLVEDLLDRLSYNKAIDTYIYSYLKEDTLGREVVSILFSIIEKEDYRYSRLVRLLG